MRDVITDNMFKRNVDIRRGERNVWTFAQGVPGYTSSPLDHREIVELRQRQVSFGQPGGDVVCKHSVPEIFSNIKQTNDNLKSYVKYPFHNDYGHFIFTWGMQCKKMKCVGNTRDKTEESRPKKKKQYKNLTNGK